MPPTFPIIWLTGNTGAGKTTLAHAVQRYFNETHPDSPLSRRVIVLDGDAMRATISTEEDLSPEGRRSHNLRVARLAKHLQSQGFLVLVSVIAPFRAVREEVSALCSPKWVYIHRSIPEHTEKPFELPLKPDCTIDHDSLSPKEAQAALVEFIERTT